MNHRRGVENSSLMSKPVLTVRVGTSAAGGRVLVARHPAYRWHDSHTGSFVQLRDPLICLIIETSQAHQKVRTRVEMAISGADSLIVAMKAGNSAGAKGWDWVGYVWHNRKGGC